MRSRPCPVVGDGRNARFGSRKLAIIALLFGFGLAALEACNGSARDTGHGRVTRRDSAGIEIVENRQPAWSPVTAWRIGSVPALQIGQVNGPEDQLLFDVVTVRDAPEGILVAQAQSLRLYDRAGRFLRQLGGAGGGPGEFVRVQSALVCGQRLWASDMLRPRLTLFMPDSSPQTLSLPPTTSGMLRTLSLQACSPDGVVVVTNGPGVDTLPRLVTRARQILVDVSRRDASLDTLLSWPGTEWLKGLRVPFGRTTLARATATHIYILDTGSPRLRIYDRGGLLTRIVRLALPRRPVTKPDIQRIRAQYLDGLSASLQSQIRPLLDLAPVPDSMPLFSSLQVAPDGTVWLRADQPFDDEPVNRWTVIDSAGVWLGEIELPPDFTVHAFGTDRVLGIWRDQNDVEYVRVYAIHR